ncbi:FliA/WhiG family RNA polymerase sigma factor [Gudongella oleilytica]|jgi:RNA polymerase sigma factor for flagellar operon FliA|uniref:sigma-70 family RNA polymerase sigma factor n=1 Tax=Gudongella oleilytica TaxID=1582259 RepID=UPI002A3629E5|nr:FliA/WhiG family RNA polymerase sigma factor [Gudongella oleilytica]MDY0256576.1 FliA/WhiG family RNA polymerase sigma factor [Gudongella oleilytica]
MGNAYENRDNLILKHLPLVRKVVGRIEFKDSAFDQDDLVSIGVMGLMDAIERYDASRKVPFEVYASLRIRGTVIDELRKSGRVSRDKIEKLNKYYQVKEDLEKTLMRTPEEKEIISQMGIDEKQLSKLHETVHYLSSVSLESTLYSANGEGFAMIDFIEDKAASSPEDDFLKKEMSGILQEAIKVLNEREQTILNLYYVEELSLKEIAYIMDVSIPRVSQLHGKILLKLRDFIKELVEVN